MSQTSQSNPSSGFLRGPQNSVIWLVAIVGLSLSLAALVLIQQQLAAHKILDFEWVAHNRVRALNHGFDNNLLAITTLHDHITASGDAHRDGFEMFAELLIERYPGIQALMWVPSAEEPHPDNLRVSNYPVLHMVPEQNNGITSGFDLGTIPRFAETLALARERGAMAISKRFSFPTQQGDTEYGFAVASPVLDRKSVV